LTRQFLIDANIGIHLRDGLESVLAKMTEHRGVVALSALSLAELQRGLHKSPEDQARRRARLATILLSIPVLSFDAAAAEAYGRVIGAVGWVKGRDFDRMIASQ
jgi:tRNA(fMet)-specific endonuclease VapC